MKNPIVKIQIHKINKTIPNFVKNLKKLTDNRKYINLFNIFLIEIIYKNPIK